MKNFDEQLDLLIESALKEDVGDGDHSTLSCIDRSEKGKAVLKIKQDAVLAGVQIAQRVFHFVEPSAKFILYKKDGDLVKSGEIAFEVEASVHTILQCERLALNCMQRMSGIATLTKKYVDKLEGYKTQLLDTRKTTPNFRLLEKEAVKIGGGINHRFGLYDMIMLKDNHIDYCGGVTNAIERSFAYVQKNGLDLKIEIEARDLDSVKEIINHGNGKVFRIMLDNFSPEKISEALILIDGIFEIEASGGINLDNIESFAQTGVDFISSGALIHQAQSVDLSLKASFL
jgi:nicotinate-nucleotide pyrophosphorylase (carboxylating)